MTSSIQAIKRGDVHRITSGQVVLDLQSALKELIENALDAGATAIEVRFKEHGAEAIEVIDNGSGIEEGNYKALALKHHTSKLASFSDLINVQTFGFRGEALSSLCELARLQVTTATRQQEPVGRLLEFERDGTLCTPNDLKKAPRQRGTTVLVSDLFHTLPVRRSELLRNIKREFAKAQALLQAYAVVSRNVRWIVTNTAKGKKTSVMTIAASRSTDYVLDNVKAVFGAKATANLVPLDLDIPLSAARHHASTVKSITYAEDNGEQIADEESEQLVRVSGLISRPAIGCGRSSSDRCFLFLNGRPWDAPKVIKAFNEVYKQFNIQQNPMVVADFAIQGSNYDVNVSPDKRTLFLHRESDILERLRAQLEHAFTPFQSQFTVTQSTPSTSHPKLPFFPATSDTSSLDQQNDETAWSQVDVRQFTGKRRQRADSTSTSDVTEDADVQQNTKQVRRGSDANLEEKVRTSNLLSDSRGSRKHLTRKDTPGQPAAIPLVLGTGKPLKSSRTIRSTERAKLDFSKNLESFAASKTRRDAESSGKEEEAVEEQIEQDEESFSSDGEEDAAADDCFSETHEPVSLIDIDEFQQQSETVSSEYDIENDTEVQETQICKTHEEVYEEEMAQRGNEKEILTPTSLDEAPMHASRKRDVNVTFNLSRISECLAAHRKKADRQDGSNQDPDANKSQGLENADIEQKDSSVADATLSRFIAKKDFSEMQIVGQFNLGFIIVRRNRFRASRLSTNAVEEDDLFIVDQHAADEKYNFEMLTQTTKLQSQKLIAPRTLQLSPAEELVAMEHVETLAANGFDLQVDEEAMPGARIKLVALPISQKTTFTVEDLEELLHKLVDERPNSERARFVKCSKLRDMLASRACRKSIMIGKALEERQMQRVIRNLGTLDRPWNCPHGRPTMRHLCDLQHSTRTLDDVPHQFINWEATLP